MSVKTAILQAAQHYIIFAVQLPILKTKSQKAAAAPETNEKLERPFLTCTQVLNR